MQNRFICFLHPFLVRREIDWSFDSGQVFTSNRLASSCLSTTPIIQRFHGKGVTLDKYAPFSSLIIIHEMRIRGCRPFQPIVPTIPDPLARLDLCRTKCSTKLQILSTYPAPTNQPQQQRLCASTSAISPYDDEPRRCTIMSTYTSAERRCHRRHPRGEP